MELPDFKQLEQDKTTLPDWAKYMEDGEFISYDNTYQSKIYFDLFDKYSFACEETGDITYYVYDPVKHGADANKTYPVLMWLHGASNSLMGDGCIMCCGAEQYASPQYQKSMGGAYLIVPLANEQRLENGEIIGCWSEEYSKPVKAIYDKVCAENAQNIGKRFVMGASAGGYFTWKLLEDYGDYFAGAIPISSYYLPEQSVLERLVASGIHLLIAQGQHDEFVPFEEVFAPRAESIEKLPNCIAFFPKWVYNGDGGISSVFYGREMGQHCMINWVQHNLIFDDGTPADDRLSEGVTGWVKDISAYGVN